MKQSITQLSLLVKDYDEAIAYYTRIPGFELIEDTQLSETKRWVVVGPKDNTGCNLLLAKASGPEQEAAIGNQTGGRVFLFLHTDDFWRDYNQMEKNGVRFIESPREEVYGTVVVFEDLYGNKWDFIEPKK